MKNLHIKIGEVVPVDLRVEIYKEAIEIIEKGEPKFNSIFHRLCLMLPCILWGLISCEEEPFENEVWCSYDTPLMFPEIDAEFVSYMDGFKYGDEEKNAVRIAHLKKSIEELTK